MAETGTTASTTDDDLIEALIYGGDVKGYMLLEWGMTPAQVLDPVLFYSVMVTYIDGEVIHAMLNSDPMGRVPYSKASYSSVPDRSGVMAFPN